MNYSAGRLDETSTLETNRLLESDELHLSWSDAEYYGIYLPEDIAFLQNHGAPLPSLQFVAERALVYQKPAHLVLQSFGLIDEEDYYRCIALELDLPFTNFTPPVQKQIHQCPSPEQLNALSRMVLVTQIPASTAPSMIHISPDGGRLGELKRFLAAHPDQRHRLRVVPLSKNRDAIKAGLASSLLRNAISGLRETLPQFSARRVLFAGQAVFLVLAVQLMLLMYLSGHPVFFLAIHLLATGFYLACAGLRLLAALWIRKQPALPKRPLRAPDRDGDRALPVYSVLVPVYDEAGQMQDLVSSLLRLNWPREKLEIKIICESDDVSTIQAAQQAIALTKGGVTEIVTVPFSQPRTKPKALNFALPLCRGDFVVIYDAEDRPHPDQLRDAYDRFMEGAEEVACVQSSLVIHNGHENWLSRLFAIEYSCLFDGLVPFLVRCGSPIPLGGTSNHFRKEALQQVGAWDPYNVTEDADLGFRLARAGYQVEAIPSPTFEEAPVSLLIWLRQRTRWFKGWYQTLLVHMRSPASLIRDLGWKGFVFFHVLLSGMAISALVHPIILYFVFSSVVSVLNHGAAQTLLAPIHMMDMFTVLAGYLTFIALALTTLPRRNQLGLASALWVLPVYWLLLSVAAWRAVFHLTFYPHKWEKTPHRLRLSPRA